MPGTISTEQALIYVMVTMSGVEGKINATELKEIGRVVKSLPIFKNFDTARLTTVAQECGEMLQEPEGLMAVLGLARDQLFEFPIATGEFGFRKTVLQIAKQRRRVVAQQNGGNTLIGGRNQDRTE